MKNWEGENFLQLPWLSLFQFAPHLLEAHAFFAPPPVEAMVHDVTTDHDESESYRPTICRHCVDQQTDTLVFIEFQSDHRE